MIFGVFPVGLFPLTRGVTLQRSAGILQDACSCVKKMNIKSVKIMNKKGEG
jgi:hypothetical protein